MATSRTSDAQPGPEDAPDTTAGQDSQPIREAIVKMHDANLAAIGIVDLVSLLRRTGIDKFEVLSSDQQGAVVQLELRDKLPSSQLTTFDTVGRWEHASMSDTERYVLEVTTPKFPTSLASTEADLFGTPNLTITNHGLTITLIGTQAAIAAVVEEYERLGLAPDLRKLGPYDGRDWMLDSLTDRQREVVTTAYELGYYEVPREITTDDIARELGIDASTVTEHLQRAERNLFGLRLSN